MSLNKLRDIIVIIKLKKVSFYNVLVGGVTWDFFQFEKCAAAQEAENTAVYCSYGTSGCLITTCNLRLTVSNSFIAILEKHRL